MCELLLYTNVKMSYFFILVYQGSKSSFFTNVRVFLLDDSPPQMKDKQKIGKIGKSIGVGSESPKSE